MRQQDVMDGGIGGGVQQQAPCPPRGEMPSEDHLGGGRLPPRTRDELKEAAKSPAQRAYEQRRRGG